MRAWHLGIPGGLRLSVIVALAPMALAAQAAPAPWTRDSIRSEVLGETRQLRIALPRGYNAPIHADDRYPVLIILDAQSDLMSTTAMVNANSLGLPGDPAIPQLVIVGVETSANRYRDMTPEMPGGATGNYAGAGGAPAFLKFLSTELAPYIARRYRTAPTTVLAGHSMSGLFAAWAYGQAPGFLVGAVALSPALQESHVFTGAALEGITKRSRPGRLFVLNSAEETVPLDSAVRTFADELRARKVMGSNFAYQRIDVGSHNHTQMLGMMPGLQFVFAPVSLRGSELTRLARRMPEAKLIETFEQIRGRYARAARELGMPEALPSSYLSTVTIQFRDPAGSPVWLRICRELTTAYPQLWSGYSCTAEAQLVRGDTAAATSSYNRALENARRIGDSTAVADLTGRLARLRK